MTARQELLEAIIDAIHGRRDREGGPFPGLWKSVILPRYERLADAILSARGDVAKLFDPQHGDDVCCAREGCGHTYYRHFDTHDDMAPVGCKYCRCGEFVEPGEALPTPPKEIPNGGAEVAPEALPTSSDDPSEEKVAHRLLHRLWTKAVGTEGYEKDLWKNLEASLFRLSRKPSECRSCPHPAHSGRCGWSSAGEGSGCPCKDASKSNPVCGNHWHGLTGAMVDGSTGCPWCHIERLQQEVQRLEANGDEAKFSPVEWFQNMLRLRLEAYPKEPWEPTTIVKKELLQDILEDVEKFIEETARANRRK